MSQQETKSNNYVLQQRLICCNATNMLFHGSKECQWPINNVENKQKQTIFDFNSKICLVTILGCTLIQHMSLKHEA